ncbi:MAG: type I phosphomannose isomerase catalytic subunit [Breznakia sp.]
MKMMRLSPAYKDYLWGGNQLKTRYAMKSSADKIAEAWELSAHKDGPSIIENGVLKGKTFIEYLNGLDKAKLGKKAQQYDKFPILIKFIDAKQALSIQVHPDDPYALKHEHEYGKNEMWYIVDCKKDSFLYYGVNQTISKEEFKKRIENDTVLDVLKKVPVKPGDCFYIKAGTIHAIGEGILICEIQQSSNSTYRVYDFGRVGVDGKPRKLHIQKAVDVSNLSPINTDAEASVIRHDDIDYKASELAMTPYFETIKYDVKESVAVCCDASSFHSLVFLSGSACICLHEEIMEVHAGDSIFIEANAGKYTVKGNCTYIQTNL